MCSNGEQTRLSRQRVDSYRMERYNSTLIWQRNAERGLDVIDSLIYITGNPGKARLLGWDPIFIPTGHDKTWAEMTDEEARETSMRRIALKKLEAYLKSK